ncbi:MAG: hypothetical protein H6Q52_2788 [Deltaproteobacteria bacterium]|nr:hypothetical protein [Deltaproteobacteria bacterium]
MTIRSHIRAMCLAALVAMALGGFLLHLRIHPFTQNTSFLTNFMSGVLSIIVVPLLFLRKETIHYGYVLNGFIAIVGTVTMAHFSLANPPAPLTPASIFLKTTLADILILWGKFFIGKVLFDCEVFGYNKAVEKKGVSYRYPNLGWWCVHLGAVAVVYYAGHLLGK